MTESSPPQVRRAFLYLFANFLLFGGIATTVGATLPLVIRQFGWSYLAAGWMFAGSAAGFFISTFITGMLLPKLGARKVMLVGLVLQSVGIGFFGYSDSLALNLMFFVVLGLGQGAVEVTTNVAVVSLEASGKSRLMNLVHSAFTIGAMAAPFLAGLLTWMNASWRVVYIVMAVSGACMLAWTWNASWLSGVHESSGDSKGDSKLQLFRDPLLLLLAGTIFFYVGAEIGISNWIAEYFVKIHETSTILGALMVALLWFGVFLGRIGLGMGYRGVRLAQMLVFCSFASLLFLGLALWSDNLFGAAVFFFLTGVGYSIIYPCVMSIIGLSFRYGQSAAIGFVSTSGGMGVCLFPFAMSAVSERLGLVAGFFFYLALTALMCLCAWLAMLLLNRRQK
jgi:fucose permease